MLKNWNKCTWQTEIIWLHWTVLFLGLFCMVLHSPLSPSLYWYYWYYSLTLQQIFFLPYFFFPRETHHIWNERDLKFSKVTISLWNGDIWSACNQTCSTTWASSHEWTRSSSFLWKIWKITHGWQLNKVSILVRIWAKSKPGFKMQGSGSHFVSSPCSLLTSPLAWFFSVTCRVAHSMLCLGPWCVAVW